MEQQKMMTIQSTGRNGEKKDYLAGMKAFVAMTIESPEFFMQSREVQYENAHQTIKTHLPH